MAFHFLPDLEIVALYREDVVLVPLARITAEQMQQFNLEAENLIFNDYAELIACLSQQDATQNSVFLGDVSSYPFDVFVALRAKNASYAVINVPNVLIAESMASGEEGRNLHIYFLSHLQKFWPGWIPEHMLTIATMAVQTQEAPGEA